MSARCDSSRSAPAVFVPVAAAGLDDPDPEVRSAALSVLRQAGAAAGPYADVVAAVAARFPDRAGDPGRTDEYRAVETLQRLGDPRWVAPVCEAAARGHRSRFAVPIIRLTPQVRAAMEACPSAAELLRREPEPTSETVASLLEGGHWLPWATVPDLGGLGAALLPVLPAATALLTGAADPIHPRRDRQMLAARVVAALRGPEEALATVEAVLAAGGDPARHAAGEAPRGEGQRVVEVSGDPAGRRVVALEDAEAGLGDLGGRLSHAGT